MKVCSFYDSDNLMDVTQNSDESTSKLTIYSGMDATVVSALVEVSVVRATGKLFQSVLHAYV